MKTLPSPILCAVRLALSTSESGEGFLLQAMLTYFHKFKDGSTVTLTVDLSQTVPRMKATPYQPGNDAEYSLWRNTIVAADILPLLTVEQLEAVSAIGKRINQSCGKPSTN